MPVYMDYEKLSVNDSVTTLTAAKVTHATYGKAREIMLSPEDDDIRITYHGTDPVNTGGSEVGHRVYQGQQHSIKGWDEIDGLKILNATPAGTATVHVTYWYR